MEAVVYRDLDVMIDSEYAVSCEARIFMAENVVEPKTTSCSWRKCKSIMSLIVALVSGLAKRNF